MNGIILVIECRSVFIDKNTYPKTEISCNPPKISNDLIRPILLINNPATIAPNRTEIGPIIPSTKPIWPKSKPQSVKLHSALLPEPPLPLNLARTLCNNHTCVCTSS